MVRKRRKINVTLSKHGLRFSLSRHQHTRPVAKPQIFGEPCNTIIQSFFAVSTPPRCAFQESE